jgi:hypothetical protein
MHTVRSSCLLVKPAPDASAHRGAALQRLPADGLSRRPEWPLEQVAPLNTDTGELRDQELSHVGDDVERFCAALSPPVTVGIESTGYSLWFHALLQRLGHTLLVARLPRFERWWCGKPGRIAATPGTCGTC